MSYRLADVTDPSSLPLSHFVAIVPPEHAAYVIRGVLDPYTSTPEGIENLDDYRNTVDRTDDLIDQVVRGELVVTDVSGASPGIFRNRQAEPESLLSTLPPLLHHKLEKRWEEDGAASGFAGTGAAYGGDSLHPAIEPEYQPPAPVVEIPPVGSNQLKLIYRWPDGTPVAGAPYYANGLDDGIEGVLDKNGEALLTDLRSWSLNVRFGERNQSDQLRQLRRELRGTLKATINLERQNAAAMTTVFDKLSWGQQRLVEFGAGYMGVWDGAVGFATTAKAIMDFSPVVVYNRAAKAAWDATRDSSDQAWVDAFKQNFNEDNKRALLALLGFDPEAITTEQLAEAYETTSLILADPESRDMLMQFAVDFAEAQHHVEVIRFAGPMVFDLVLGIVLAAATGGAGAALAAPRYFKRLAGIGKELKALARHLKSRKKTRYHHSVSTSLHADKAICESVCDRRDPSVDLEVRSLASRRLHVTSLTEAIDALKASRQRILRRGGFTPKYTQAELLQLVDEGLDNDRYIVRLVETTHIDGLNQPKGSMLGNLGRKDAKGEVRYWSTTLDQVESRDTDPKAIAELLGVVYDPKATYKLAIIDKEAALKHADAETIVPTFGNLAGYAETKLTNKAGSPEQIRSVMTSDYQATYEALYKGMGETTRKNVDMRAAYLHKLGLDTNDIKAFETRFNIHEGTGANQYFLGNGLTKHTALSRDEVVHGALETLTFEKNPQTFREITNGGRGGPNAYVELVDLVPIDFGE